ncbi:hypothetical protein VP01_2927g1 [Puccinia sorghi]|uniref:RING-type domain-containing protein n=1 Tax=Puccinia sorghi TaxID=27349 RepID=A0A0L6V0Z6_9BASI|nr:hypothetical protein VP01_2944g1 [Puccinia sorghi]KNZ54520.1 hypothetical protein VP01_2927g1 [Puccinia sorghi]
MRGDKLIAGEMEIELAVDVLGSSAFSAAGTLKSFPHLKEMLAIASGSQLLDRAARPSLRRSSSLPEASAGKKPVKPAPPLNDCPICLESLKRKTYLKIFPRKIQVKRWPGCLHGYHPHCYKEMVDQQQPCAICRKPCPPLSAARLKSLESPRVSPSEPDQDEIAALEVLQTDLDLTELVPEISTTRGDRASTSGSSHTHEGASGSVRIYEDDEALARALSFSLQQEARHHPGTSTIMFDEPHHSWSGPGTSSDQDLALALSLQEEFIRESQGGNSRCPIHDALPDLAELSDAWRAPDTSRDANYARQIERELNGQRPLPPRSISQGHPFTSTIFHFFLDIDQNFVGFHDEAEC